MARAEILTARCDRKECKTIVEIDRSLVAPEGWLQVAVEIEGKWDTASKLEFCSEKCVAIWARNRGSSVSYDKNGNGTSRNVREEVIAAIKILESDGQWEWSVPDLAKVCEIEKTTVRKYVKEFESEGKVEFRKGEGTRMSPSLYGRVTNTEL